jgi:hypothetical protein
VSATASPEYRSGRNEPIFLLDRDRIPSGTSRAIFRAETGSVRGGKSTSLPSSARGAELDKHAKFPIGTRHIPHRTSARKTAASEDQGATIMPRGIFSPKLADPFRGQSGCHNNIRQGCGRWGHRTHFEPGVPRSRGNLFQPVRPTAIRQGTRRASENPDCSCDMLYKAQLRFLKSNLSSRWIVHSIEITPDRREGVRMEI